MQGIIYDQFRAPLQLKQLPNPEPGEGSVIIQVKAAGLCRSDWHGWKGHDSDIKLPHVPGHEFSGVIVAKGKNVKKLAIGQRIVVPFCCGCGKCKTCRQGGLHICEQYFQPGFTHWGCFAELVEIKYADQNCYLLPEAIDFETAACLGCRFITAFRAVIDRGGVKPGQQIAVFGCGGLGLAIIMIAQAIGARVAGIDINPQALEIARKIGAEQTFDPNKLPVVEAILGWSKGGADSSFDALGSAITASQSILSLKKQGRHIQVGLLKDLHDHPPLPMGRVIADEIDILGSHGMPATDFSRLFTFIDQVRIDPRQYIKQRISLDKVVTALPDMEYNQHSGVTIINKFN